MDKPSTEQKIAMLADQQGKTVEQVNVEIEDAIDAIMASDNPEINLLRAVMIPHKGRITPEEYLQLTDIMNHK